MSPVEAVVFDLDNTLVNSRVDFGEMRRRILARVSRELPEVDLEGARTTIELMDRIGDQLPPERLMELMVELHEIMNGTEMEAVPRAAIITGVPDLMGQLKGMGLRLGLLTRSCSEYTNAALGGLLDLFDSVSCRELDAPSKPDPQALLLLCEEMGTKPRHTVLVGDHVMDAVCANLAHAMFVGVTTGSSSSADLSKLPHLAILDDLEELPSIIVKLNADG